jgi:hypothetical protein
MTIAAIRNAILSHLSGSGPWAASELSACSFHVLEQVSACCITFFPEGTSEIAPLSFGGGETFGAQTPIAQSRAWRIGGTLWIRDTGDAEDVLSRIWQGYDDLYATFHKDNSLGETCQNAVLVSIAQITDRFRLAGGQLWKPVEWVLVADEY